MSTIMSSRGSAGGGGITKRGANRAPRARIDRDGDLDMDAPQGGRGGNGGGRGRGRRGNRVNINHAPRGPAAERKSGSGVVSTRSRDTRRDPIGTRSRAGASLSSRISADGPLVSIRVDGWKQSKGSAEECVAFLERKAHIKFSKTHKQGNYLIVYVPASKMPAVLEWDNAKFAGVNLKIQSDLVDDAAYDNTITNATPKNSDTTKTIDILGQVLANRYNPESKLLDLSNLGEDPLLRQNGFFELNSTTSKMFPALMSVADRKFQSAKQKQDMIQSVSLANNNIKTVTVVSALSFTFPDIKNLSLENNLIEDLKGLDPWKQRFKRLEQLILTGNPVVNLPAYRDEMIRRYPLLVLLDNVQVDRPMIEIGDSTKAAASQSAPKPPTMVGTNGKTILPLPVKGNLTVSDDNGLVRAFLATFFSEWDTNKPSILEKFYTAQSTFSVSVNTSAPRVAELQGERQYWDVYIAMSRNLKRVRNDGELDKRLAQGVGEIGEMWQKFPPSRHNMADQSLWSFDMFPVEVTKGVMGMMATVHSEFEEANPNAPSILKRSFDRSFGLALDDTGNLKVFSDLFVVRSYAGAKAWSVDADTTVTEQQAPQTVPDVAEQRNRIQMLSEKSGLNLKYAEMCLNQSGWDLSHAWDVFITAQAAGNLGPEAYLQKVA